MNPVLPAPEIGAVVAFGYRGAREGFRGAEDCVPADRAAQALDGARAEEMPWIFKFLVN